MSRGSGGGWHGEMWQEKRPHATLPHA